jgi:DNA-binding response OmpR family regulator
MRVLIVEDDSAVSLLLQDSLARRQHVIAGTARGLDAGLRLAGSADYDCAIVDIDLAGTEALPLVELLEARRRPFVLITGLFADDIASPRLQAMPRLVKPFDCEALDLAMERACARRCTSAQSPMLN